MVCQWVDEDTESCHESVNGEIKSPMFTEVLLPLLPLASPSGSKLLRSPEILTLWGNEPQEILDRREVCLSSLGNGRTVVEGRELSERRGPERRIPQAPLSRESLKSQGRTRKEQKGGHQGLQVCVKEKGNVDRHLQDFSEAGGTDLRDLLHGRGRA